MNKVKLIADIAKRQDIYWAQINELYASALKKNYETRQVFDLKLAPYQTAMPTNDWLEISRLVGAVEELENFKTYIKSQKRGVKESDEVTDPDENEGVGLDKEAHLKDL